jgi:hypothetical protein
MVSVNCSSYLPRQRIKELKVSKHYNTQLKGSESALDSNLLHHKTSGMERIKIKGAVNKHHCLLVLVDS